MVFTALRTVIFQNRYVYIDLWSIVHFFTAMLLVFFLYFLTSFLPFDKRSIFIHLGVIFTAIAIVIIYELVEPFIFIFTQKETFLNILWDIIIGVLGVLFAVMIRLMVLFTIDK